MDANAYQLALNARPAPRHACLAEGGDVLDRHRGLTRILDILRSYFAPGAADATREQVARTANYRRSDQSVDEGSAE